MVLGIVGVFGWCFYGMGVIAGILALVFGYQARREIRSGSWERGPIGGGGQATAGIVLGWVTIGLTIAAVVVIAVALVASSSGSPNGY